MPQVETCFLTFKKGDSNLEPYEVVVNLKTGALVQWHIVVRLAA